MNNEFILRKHKVVFDIECNPNISHVGFKSLENGKVIQIETPMGEDESLSAEDITKLRKIMTSYTVIGFNSSKYDIPMVKGMLKGKSNIELFNMSCKLIQGNMQPWLADKEFDLGFLKCTHIDLFEPSPGVNISLKKYGARLHSQKIQDLPYDYAKSLTKEEHELNKLYNINDLNTTIDLYEAVKGEIDIRYIMSDNYKMDLMSKGGPQIAEAIIIHELGKKGVTIEKFKPPKNYIIKYTPPECLSFKNQELNNILNNILDEDFVLSKGKVVLPKWLQKPIKINGKFLVQMGIGGLHSKEKSIVVVSDEDYILKNCDIASYYPNLIMAYGYYPKNIGKMFLSVFSGFYARRISIKHIKEFKSESDSLKLLLNGTFGKLGSNYSKIFAPELLIHVTLSGQLLMIMLIEKLLNAGIEVISTNTDGIEYKVLRSREKEIEELINDWDNLTGMPMEHGSYHALYARDVNNYCAVYNKEVKEKGVYGKPTIQKDATHQIVYEAIRLYLFDRTPIEETIRSCTDVRKFILCKSATGGADWTNPKTNEVIFLGKVVRWYYSRANGNAIIKIKPNVTGTRAKVPTTDFAVPIMDLPQDYKLPKDLDIEYYILIAINALSDLGVDYIADDVIIPTDLMLV
jgi:DNA polymerase elongation subunit (family B)